MIMTKFKVAALAGVLTSALSGAYGSGCDHTARPEQGNVARTCGAIRAADGAGTLSSDAAETKIKLDAAKAGVADTLRGAIDQYYVADKAGDVAGMTAAQTSMLNYCRGVG